MPYQIWFGRALILHCVKHSLHIKVGGLSCNKYHPYHLYGSHKIDFMPWGVCNGGETASNAQISDVTLSEGTKNGYMEK